MPLDADKRKKLRGIGHALEPVIIVAGNGLHDALMQETERALRDHELIKIRLAIEDRTVRKQTADEICLRLGAESVQQIGKLVLIYRHNPQANPRLSNLYRQPRKT